MNSNTNDDQRYICPRCSSDRVELSLLDPIDVAFFCWQCNDNIFNNEVGFSIEEQPVRDQIKVDSIGIDDIGIDDIRIDVYHRDRLLS